MIVVPTALGAIFGGPGLGILIAVVILAAIVLLAVRARPKDPIEAAAAPDATHRVLLALTEPVEDAATAEEVVRAAKARDDRPTEILALAPTRPHFLDRWASDVREARAEARHELDVTVGSLRRAGVSKDVDPAPGRPWSSLVSHRFTEASDRAAIRPASTPGRHR